MKVITVTPNPAIDRTYFADDFTVGAVNRAKEVMCEAGGKGINFTAAVRKCGIKCVASGFLGRGGEGIEALLESEKTESAFVKTKSDIRVNIKICDLKNGTYTDLNESGGNVAEDEVQSLIETLKRVTQSGDYLYMGGSLPPGADMGLYKDIIEVGKKCGAVTVLDASGGALAEGIKAQPGIIKPNRHEAEELLGVTIKTEIDAFAAAKALRGKGINTVLISLDADGALAAADDGVCFAYPAHLEIRGTVGAGDAFLAGFVYGKTENFDTENALKYAMSFAAAKISAGGTAIPPFEELVKFKDGIICKKVF